VDHNKTSVKKSDCVPDDTTITRAIESLVRSCTRTIVEIVREATTELPTRSSSTSSDRLMNVHEAAKRLNVSTKWMYKHASELPFAVRFGALVRFSEKGIEDYIRSEMEG
jgi:predicted DNA-binding transcriptional regulator AlpA